MIKNSRSLSAMIFLFLNFLFISRYVQQIIFDDDLSNTFFHRLVNKRNVCEPHIDSILGQYNRNDKRVLFVMLDSYPEESLYKKLVGKIEWGFNWLEDLKKNGIIADEATLF